MFKKKFDRLNGEIRHCKMCDKDFHTMKPTWHCMPCTSKKIYESAVKKHGEGVIPTGKYAGQPKKKPYPFSTKRGKVEQLGRFRDIRRALNKCETKEQRREHYAKQLEEIKTNGIWEWIWDRRDDETAKKSGTKSKTFIDKHYPDLRGYYEE